jgi:hypothetical protein
MLSAWSGGPKARVLRNACDELCRARDQRLADDAALA